MNHMVSRNKMSNYKALNQLLAICADRSITMAPNFITLSID